MTTTISTPSKGLRKRSQTTSISIDSVTFGYNDTPTLQNISLQMQEGDFGVFFGPNGGGKTTLIKLLLGFLQPHTGHISLFGKSPERIRPQVGYVPQKGPTDALFPLTTLDVVLQGALSHTTWWGHLPKEWREKGRALLHQMGLSPYESYRFGELSGGLAQRALIARALLPSPSLVVLDEPTAHVDPKAEEEIIELLLSLKRKTTLLLITHNLKQVAKDADHLICVHRSLVPYKQKDLCTHFSLGLYTRKGVMDDQ